MTWKFTLLEPLTWPRHLVLYEKVFKRLRLHRLRMIMNSKPAWATWRNPVFKKVYSFNLSLLSIGTMVNSETPEWITWATCSRERQQNQDNHNTVWRREAPPNSTLPSGKTCPVLDLWFQTGYQYNLASSSASPHISWSGGGGGGAGVLCVWNLIRVHSLASPYILPTTSYMGLLRPRDIWCFPTEQKGQLVDGPLHPPLQIRGQTHSRVVMSLWAKHGHLLVLSVFH